MAPVYAFGIKQRQQLRRRAIAAACHQGRHLAAQPRQTHGYVQALTPGLGVQGRSRHARHPRQDVLHRRVSSTLRGSGFVQAARLRTHPLAGFMGWNQLPENAIQVDLPCRPCSIYGNKPCARGDYACLNRIEARTVLNRVLGILYPHRGA